MRPDNEYDSSPSYTLVGETSPYRSIGTLIEFLRKHLCTVGKPSVENLYSYLVGFACAKANLGFATDLEYLSEFNVWVRNWYKIDTDQGWDKIIVFFSHDEPDGIRLFWKLYDEFLGSKRTG